LHEFLDDRCVTSDQSRVRYGDLYQSYLSWCKDSGEVELTTRQLRSRLIERGFNTKPGAGNKKYWHGIGLKAGGFTLSKPNDDGGGEADHEATNSP